SASAFCLASASALSLASASAFSLASAFCLATSSPLWGFKSLITAVAGARVASNAQYPPARTTRTAAVTPAVSAHERRDAKSDANPTAFDGGFQSAGGGARWAGDCATLRGLPLALTIVASLVGSGAEYEPLRQAVIDCGRSFGNTVKPASIISSSSREKPPGASSTR